MFIKWRVKKQFFILFIVFLVFAITVFFVWRSLNAPTCFDGKQNQEETGIDCGGACAECIGEIKDLIVGWSKVIKLENENYEVAGMVENPNLFLGIKSLKYTFRLYDSNNILVAVKDGETFVNPGDRFALLETNINVGRRVPERAYLEFEEFPQWINIKPETSSLVILKKYFVNEPFPRLTVEVGNKEFNPVDDISASVALYDNDGGVIGVSSTRINSVAGNSSRSVVFTWPKPFSEEPVSNEIFFRVR